MVQQTSPPNILFIVWDACRYDYAQSHAKTFADLATNNLSFEHAITPATWSLPSHASLFNGEYPSSHGSRLITDQIDASPLTNSLQADDYTCYSVSGNSFASHRTGFHDSFDETYYTQGEEPFLDALGVYSHVMKERNKSTSSVDVAYKTFRAALAHDQPIRSLLNLAAVGTGRAASKIDLLQHLPGSIFSDMTGYNFSEDQHTSKIEDILEKESQREDPFFLFTNYVTTHRPYKPNPVLQEKHLGDRLSHNEIVRLNRDIASSWGFLEHVEANNVDERDVERVRGLYAGEVETADAHLNRLLQTLKREGLHEDTLVIVTADHGENLGEVDEMGRQRMGHGASMSEHLLRVPLVIAHPELEGRQIEEHVSLKDIFALLTEEIGELLNSEGVDLGSLLPDDDMVLSEDPAAGGEQLYEKHPAIPREIIEDRVVEDAVAAYADDWKIVMESTGEKYAWHEGEEQPFKNAPEALRNRCKKQLTALNALSEDQEELSEVEVEQLEALGYL